MKTFYLTLTVIALLLLSTNTAQAQTTQPKLNQVELMKQFIGTWEGAAGKDTTVIAEQKPYGTGQECYWKSVTKGKIAWEGKQLYGYDKKIDKFIYVNLTKGEDIEIEAMWFISNNKCIDIPYSDIANLDKATVKGEIEFKSPDAWSETNFKNGKPVMIYNYKRVK
jgi:hypothetical protein